MSNPYLDRIAARGKQGHGKLSEKKVAQSLGARLHPNSGSMGGAKGDASLGDYRMEMKSTTSNRLPVERAWLEKITAEALRQGQKPALAMSFVNPDGSQQQGSQTWIALPEWVFKELVK